MPRQAFAEIYHCCIFRKGNAIFCQSHHKKLVSQMCFVVVHVPHFLAREIHIVLRKQAEVPLGVHQQ